MPTGNRPGLHSLFEKALQSTITKAELHQTSHRHSDKQASVQNNRYKSRSCCRCRHRWGPTSHWAFIGTCSETERHALVTNQLGDVVVLCYNAKDWIISCCNVSKTYTHIRGDFKDCHCSCLTNVLSVSDESFTTMWRGGYPLSSSSHPLCLPLFALFSKAKFYPYPVLVSWTI